MSKICCFAGHNIDYDNKVGSKLRKECENLIANENINEFWVGNYGKFDTLAAETVKKLKLTYSHINLNLILPYFTNEINENKEYYKKMFDNILLADIPDSTPPKFRIIKANQYMVNNSDFLACFIEHPWGGAYKTFKYAKTKKHIKIINIAL